MRRLGLGQQGRQITVPVGDELGLLDVVPGARHQVELLVGAAVVAG